MNEGRHLTIQSKLRKGIPEEEILNNRREGLTEGSQGVWVAEPESSEIRSMDYHRVKEPRARMWGGYWTTKGPPPRREASHIILKPARPRWALTPWQGHSDSHPASSLTPDNAHQWHYSCPFFSWTRENKKSYSCDFIISQYCHVTATENKLLFPLLFCGARINFRALYMPDNR